MREWESIEKLAAGVRSGQLKAADLVEKSLRLIEQHQEFRSIIATVSDRSHRRARKIDEMVSRGEDPGVLAGVPFIAKDNFLVFGADTTAASNILKGFDAPFQSTAIEKLEEAGAICVAKANLDAFAHGSSTENSDFYATKNPYDASKVPGGSSGGSAASVALQLAPFSLGTDTGGSIRLPASFCGVVGLKPTYGLVSRSGVVAMASSTDVIGPLANSVEDAALVLDVMAGQDVLDSTTINRQESYQVKKGSDLSGKKIGVVKEYFGEGLDPNVGEAVNSSIEKLKEAGAEIVEVSLPSLALSLSVYYIVCSAEISSNLARYDGQRFGYFDKIAKNLDESYENSRAQGFGAEAKRRIMIGTYVLSSGYYEAYYKKAQTVRTKLINEFEDALKRVDFLVGPTAPITAFELGSKTTDPLAMYMVDMMTVGVNLVGVPAISLPCGRVDNMPVGLQIIGGQRQDVELLELSKTVQELLK